MMNNILAVLIVLFMSLVLVTASADEVLRAFIVQQESGQLKACSVLSYSEAVCWDMVGPALSCIPITETNPTLLCNTTEVKTY